MKFHHILLAAVILLAACSSPKYTYHFDNYDYNSGRKQASIEATTEESPLKINEETVVASVDNNAVAYEIKKEVQEENMKTLASRYKSMSKGEQKEFRKELKKDLKSVVKREKQNKKGVESVGATKAFDTMLALAMVFGAAGIIFTILASVSNVFWILGAISIVIGAYFFIQWVNNGNG